MDILCQKIKEQYTQLEVTEPTLGVIRIQKGNTRLELYPKRGKYFLMQDKEQKRGVYYTSASIIEETFKQYLEFDAFKIESKTIEEIIDTLNKNNVRPAPMLVQSIYYQNTGKYFDVKIIKEMLKTA